MGSHKETETMFTDRAARIMKNMPDYVKSYIRSIHNRISPRTKYEYLKDLDKFLRYTAGKNKDYPTLRQLSELDKEFFEEYLEYLEHYEENGREQTNDRASIKRKLSALRSFFGYLFETNQIPSDEVRKVAIPKIPKKEIICLENMEAYSLLAAVESGAGLTGKAADYHKVQSVRDAALILLLLSTGMRVSECAELDVTDIDMDRCQAKITRKGGNESIVYFSDEAAAALSRYLEQRKCAKCPETEKALFLSSRNKRFSVRAIEYLVKKYAARSVPMKHITPHKLRATYATQLYNRTGDIYLVADALGHKDVDTTKDHYANLSESRKKENRNTVTYKNDD